MLKVILFSPNGYVGNCIKEELNKHRELEILEITRESNWNAISGNYDVFIYSASVTSARNASADQYIKDNALCATEVVKFCERHCIKRIIYLSTDEIYGQLHVEQVGEEAVMISPNIYAVTKYLAEKIIVESGISYYILRLSGIVGRRWGCSFLYRLMEQAAKGEEIILYNAGNDFNNVVYIDDLTDFILLLVRRNDYADSRIFLLGNTKKMRLQDLAEYIKAIYQSNSTIEQIEKRDGRYFTLDVSKAVEYGYHSRDIREIIKELYWLKQEKEEN